MSEIPGAAVAAYDQNLSRPLQVAGGSTVEIRSRAWPGVRIAVHADLTGVEQVWRSFEARAECTVFQNFDYLRAWFRHLGTRQQVTPAIVVLRDRDNVLAILPLAVTRERFRRRLTWLGQELCDYLNPLLASEFADTPPERFRSLWRETIDLMQSQPRFRHDWVELRRMPQTVGEMTNPLLALPTDRHASDAYVMRLGADWEAFYRERRSAKARKQDRSKLSRLAELGAVELASPQQSSQISETLDTLFLQKSQTLDRKGIDDIFCRPGYREFFLDLACNPRTRESTHVSTLVVGSTLAAVNFGMEYRKRYSLFLVSYDRSLGRLSPGVIHLNKLIERAVGRGLKEFDFLVGEQRLKLEWADRKIPLHDYIAASTWRGALWAIPARAFSLAKRTVKQTPILWRAFQSIRAAVGAVRQRAGI
jgi:CelD/BcsL family acetyltransferase involved in cellulose biosynthesis